MIFDCFPYFNEHRVVYGRMAELAQDVDMHILSEATVNFRGNPKALDWVDNDRPAQAPEGHAPILALVVSTLDIDPVNGMPEGPDNWRRENHQRDVLVDVAWTLAQQNDLNPDNVLLLSTDADEIVRADKIQYIWEATAKSPVSLEMIHFYYGPQWVHPTPWRHPKALRLSHTAERTLSQLRLDFSLPVVYDAGYHLGYFGDAEWVHAKVRSFAHQELDTPEFHAQVEAAIRRGYVIHEGVQLTRVEPEHFLPQTILEHL